MPNSKFGVTLDNVWADYRRCARRSRALKVKLDGVRMSALVLVTLSGVLGLLSTQLPESLNPARILSFASALAAAMGGYISAQALSFGLEREWVLSRGIAEALKSEAYLYLSRVVTLCLGSRQVENDETLSQRAGEYRDRITLGAFSATGRRGARAGPARRLADDGCLSEGPCPRPDRVLREGRATEQRARRPPAQGDHRAWERWPSCWAPRTVCTKNWSALPPGYQL